ncbi:MAG: histidine phosphatase family protein [Bifidobacteriaceae bacterium]|jgi:probable phosphoglycerate mutase|nr:histidine phosphatase family protein [Bifidobacteriaceae bacterium]
MIVWRHGQTAHNLAGLVQGRVDIPLDGLGRAQAARAARALAAWKPDRIIASPLARAEATAARLGEAAGVAVELDGRLVERAFGEWEGMGIGEIAERWPAEHAAWRTGRDVESIGMETRAAAAERWFEAVAEAAGAVADGGTLAVVSHGGVIVCGLTRLLGLDPQAWFGLRVMANAHWAVVEASGHAPRGWRLAGYDLGAEPSEEELSGWF